MNHLIYIVPVAISLFWVIRIFLLKEVNRVQLFIIAGMLAAALSAFRMQAALFPFAFFYLAVRQKTSPLGTSKWDFLIFLPSVGAMMLHGSLLFDILLVLQVTGISIWILVKLLGYGKMLAELYDESEVSADDIWQVMIFTMISVVAVTTLTLLPQEAKSNIWIQAVFSVFISVLQYFTGHYAFQVRDKLPDIDSAQAKPQAEYSEPNGAGENLLKKVSEEQLYLDPYLSLVSLAEKLQTNRTYLSASIHGCTGKNFSDYINSLRVEHFIRLVHAGEFTSIKDAAFNSGYNNLQSFYRHFSEIMQMTPKTWISRQ